MVYFLNCLHTFPGQTVGGAQDDFVRYGAQYDIVRLGVCVNIFTAKPFKDTSYGWGPKMTPLLRFIQYLH